ncbi:MULTISPECIES: hypothetical protein [unclassified Pseudoalteromonas]|uniref:hypothetical protein n=1 Tax=unclassified Pseudoalteromonas TaxID=194690 RepID=UPI00110946C8|nr:MULTISPECIES: hypothetical protein [unclassified Pseudoalteromonas]TMN83535.1 hypothetical protein CWB64_07500 [Pseudoalteromonas sp. S410]TMN88234.1 hypothetical protein CWB62_16205 [Pseudoalteromonas sp. S408]TMN94478.1 hypothetical protein CWB61_18150 [Pseudoalteromonas sp. S407]TMN99057.1 hypothetical protein CWB63_10675 [Pseudoalteromonas sp. S409]TMO10017.1 hypothetical protein CWB57_11300 [Pseudoalteromonas sp. S186]
MNIKLLFKLFIVFSLAFSFVAIAKDVKVKGYYKKNGTYVKPHYRSAPDSSINNNWTTRGNVNPYTGADGTRVRQYEWDSGNTSYSNDSNSYDSDIYDPHYSDRDNLTDSSNTFTQQDKSEQYMGDVYDGTYDLDEYNDTENPYYQSKYIEAEGTIDLVSDAKLAKVSSNDNQIENSYSIKATGLLITIITLLIFGLAIFKRK